MLHSICYPRGSLSSSSIDSSSLLFRLYLNIFVQKVLSSLNVAEFFIELAFLDITHILSFVYPLVLSILSMVGVY